MPRQTPIPQYLLKLLNDLAGVTNNSIDFIKQYIEDIKSGKIQIWGKDPEQTKKNTEDELKAAKDILERFKKYQKEFGEKKQKDCDK